MKNLVCSKSELQSLNNITFKEYLKSKEDPVTGFLTKIDVTELSDTMFKDNGYILNKYFFLDDHCLDRLQCFNITAEEYSDVIEKLKNKPEDSANLSLETASIYWKKKIFGIIIAKDLGLPTNHIDMSEYVHNREYYELYDFDDNRMYLEDKFREEEHEVPTYTERTCVVDLKLIEELHDCCILFTKKRLAMIFEVYPILCTIDDIRKYTDGFLTNCLVFQMEALQGYKAKIEKYLNDKELVEWIKKGNNDYTLYGNSKETRSDYISTYHKIVCKINDIYGDYPIEDWDILDGYIRDVISNPIDADICRLFAFKDIDDYIIGAVEKLNSRKVKVNSLDEDNDESSEELVNIEN